MMKKLNAPQDVRTCRWLSLAVLLLQLAVAAPTCAQSLYLRSDKPNGIDLLTPPPAAGSEEEVADLETVRAVVRGRTPEAEARATKSASLSMFLFEPVIGPWFAPGELPKVELLFDRVKKDIGKTIDAPKEHWKRSRPYHLEPDLLLGKPERSHSYPSGHSTRGTVYSLLFAELFPDKREQILAVGRQIGWDRIIIGKHYPTDVYAGRVLGKAVWNELMASETFRRDLAEAKAEIQSFRTAHAGNGAPPNTANTQERVKAPLGR